MDKEQKKVDRKRALTALFAVAAFNLGAVSFALTTIAINDAVNKQDDTAQKHTLVDKSPRKAPPRLG